MLAINQSYINLRDYKVYHTTRPDNRAKGSNVHPDNLKNEDYWIPL